MGTSVRTLGLGMVGSSSLLNRLYRNDQAIREIHGRSGGISLAKVGVGLDIGTSSIKIIELEGGNPIRLNRFGRIPLPEGALVGGVVKDSAAVSQAITDAFKTLQIKHKQVQVAIAGQAVVVRNIKMPLMEPAEVKNALRWEAERYIPFPVDECSMDFVIINRDEAQQEIEVMLVCAHNDIIDSHLEVLRQAGLQPLAIDIQPFALIRALGLEDTQKNSNNVAVLDIGAGSADLSIFKAGISRFTRILPLAGNRFTENVMKVMGTAFAEAEQLKIKYTDAMLDLSAVAPDSPEYKVNYAMQSALRELVAELTRSLDYFYVQQRDEPINQLVLSGGGAKINNLIPFLQQELEIKVASSLKAWEIECRNNTPAEFEAVKPIMLVALGLALREVTE
jgi:type IV pilus assembly protein PilM